MKNLMLIAVFLITAWAGQAVYAQQGFGTNEPDKSAAVDIVSTKRGLLMPRIALTATNAASPVTNPHNALMVYNTATTTTGTNDVTPGFYYWSVDAFDSTDPNSVTSKHGAGKWVRVVDADDVKTTTVSAGDGITVTPDVDGNTTDFNVKMTAGDGTDKFMMTVTNPAYPADSPDEFITEWVSLEEFLTELLDVKNGLTFDPATGSLKLGGALTEPTTITTDATNTLTLAGLQAWDDDAGADGDLADAKVVVLNSDGTLRTIDYSSLTVTADNGLTITDNNVQLGGDLTKPTTIKTGLSADDAANQDVDNTLAITGLTAAADANEIVVATDVTGVLRTVKRSISAPITGTANIGTSPITNYSPYVQEVNLAVTLAAIDIDLTLPDPTVAEGQVINIKIANTNDTHNGYLNIIYGGDTISYGALPHQGWILKSNGAAWLIVGRN